MRPIDADAALKALRKCQTYLYDARDPELKIELSSAEAAINNLPTIQQEKAQLFKEGTTFDLISRQAAIDALDVLCQEHRYKIPGKRETYSEYNEAWQDALDRAEGLIFNLPPAQPEQKTGKWMPDNRAGGGFWVCSCCKFPSEAFAANVLYKFCPNCGADMRGGQNG